MATYDELRDALRQITDVYGDPTAWQRGMSAPDIADINGYLNAESGHRPGGTGWQDPLTHKLYPYVPTSTGAHPQVPDTLIGALRNHFPGLFGPTGSPAVPTTGPAPPAAAAGLATGEQQSGRTADAVTKLHGELKKRYNILNAAEEKLSEALLNAHATTTDGQHKLDDIQKKILEAVNNPALTLDTPAGEVQFLKFLRAQVGAIADVVGSAALTADDQATTVKALAELYAAGPGGEASRPSTPAPASAVPQREPTADVAPDTSLPELSDLGLAGPPLPMADPLSSLASTLPSTIGGFPAAPLGGAGLEPFGLTGAAAPLAGLASQLSDQARRDTSGDEHAATDKAEISKDTKPTAPQSATSTAGSGAPPAGPADRPPPPPTSVELPDGSTARAATPAAAQAVRAFLAGTPLDAAYRQAGVDLPPPGTPVIAPIDPSQLAAGDVGMFKDHYVIALGAAKALKDGQVVPLASVAPAPDFLGWMRPSAPVATDPVAAAPPPATFPAG